LSRLIVAALATAGGLVISRVVNEFGVAKTVAQRLRKPSAPVRTG